MGGSTPAFVSQPSQSPKCQASDTLSPDQCRTWAPSADVRLSVGSDPGSSCVVPEKTA